MTEKIKLMADYESWPLWWLGGDKVGNIDPATLPLSLETRTALDSWSETYDATLHEDDPASSGFSSEAEAQTFEQQGIDLWQQLRQELAPGYEVAYFSLERGQLLTSSNEL